MPPDWTGENMHRKTNSPCSDPCKHQHAMRTHLRLVRTSHCKSTLPTAPAQVSAAYTMLQFPADSTSIVIWLPTCRSEHLGHPVTPYTLTASSLASWPQSSAAATGTGGSQHEGPMGQAPVLQVAAGGQGQTLALGDVGEWMQGSCWDIALGTACAAAPSAGCNGDSSGDSARRDANGSADAPEASRSNPLSLLFASTPHTATLQSRMTAHVARLDAIAAWPYSNSAHARSAPAPFNDIINPNWEANAGCASALGHPGASRSAPAALSTASAAAAAALAALIGRDNWPAAAAAAVETVRALSQSASSGSGPCPQLGDDCGSVTEGSR